MSCSQARRSPPHRLHLVERRRHAREQLVGRAAVGDLGARRAGRARRAGPRERRARSTARRAATRSSSARRGLAQLVGALEQLLEQAVPVPQLGQRSALAADQRAADSPSSAASPRAAGGSSRSRARPGWPTMRSPASRRSVQRRSMCSALISALVLGGGGAGGLASASCRATGRRAARQVPSARSLASTPLTKRTNSGWALLIAIPYGTGARLGPTILVYGSCALKPSRIESSVEIASTRTLLKGTRQSIAWGSRTAIGCGGLLLDHLDRGRPRGRADALAPRGRRVLDVELVGTSSSGRRRSRRSRSRPAGGART